MAGFKPSLSPKQMLLLKLCRVRPGKPKYVLVSGPRLSTKSVACAGAIVDHCWNVNNASVSVICQTVTVGEDQGFWTMLTEEVIPQWIAGGIGMEWIEEPRQKGTSKKLYCIITNKYGGKSRIQLDSLKDEKDVEARFKSRFYSMIYVSELSYFRERKTYDIWIECLRGISWKEDDFLFLGDTNPAEEGEESWIYKLWYEFRVSDEVDDKAKGTQKLMALMEFYVHDNIFISKERLDEQLSRYDHSEDLKARYRDGKWVRAVGNAVFFDVFRPVSHIAGEYDVPTNRDPEIILPEDNCSELLTGWDMGDINHAFVIAEKLWIQMQIGRNGKMREVSYFKFLDEVVYIGSDLSTTVFIDECMEKINWWENQIGRSVMWRNWSDRSAFNRKDRRSNVYDHQLVHQISGGRIILQAGDYQGPNSRRERVILNKKLLYENRQVICRSRCPNLIDSYQGLRKGKGNIVLDLGSKLKHCWDAASYLLAGEAGDEIMRPRSELNVGPARTGLISVPL